MLRAGAPPAGSVLRAPLTERARAMGRDLHRALVRRLAGVGPDAPGRSFRPTRRGDLRIGYYLWQFPFPSETFVRRELRGLLRAGAPVTVVADGPGDLAAMDPEERALAESTNYLKPMSRWVLAGWTLSFLARRPVTVGRLLAFVAGTRFERDKSASSDAALFARAVRVAVQMRSLGVNHVHAPWASINAFVLVVVSRLLDVTLSVHARAHDLHRDDTAFALPEKFGAAQFVVTNTRYNLEGIRALLPEAQRGRVHVVHNGLDLEEYAARPAEAGARPATREPVARVHGTGSPTLPRAPTSRILCVARLIEPKGLTVLLQACDALRTRGVAFSCDVVGGPEEPLYTGYDTKLRVMHRQLGLAGHVRFVGALPSSAVREAYRNADLFVLPCVAAANGSRDITPNALIEAMAMGLPVISTRMTGIPEIVTDGESGLLVPPGDAPALAEAIARLIDDPALRARLGRSARAAVERTFDMNRNGAEYARLFRTLC